MVHRWNPRVVEGCILMLQSQALKDYVALMLHSLLLADLGRRFMHGLDGRPSKKMFACERGAAEFELIR